MNILKNIILLKFNKKKKKSIKDDIERLIEKSLNKPLISNKLIEKKKDNIKEIKK